jgi:hypothetical protein
MMGSGRFKAWTRRWVQNPFASAFLGAIVIADMMSLPRGPGDGGTSTVGRWISGVFGSGSVGRSMAATVFVVRNGDGVLTTTSAEGESLGDVAGAIQSRPDDVLRFVFYPQAIRRLGFWALTTEETESKLVVDTMLWAGGAGNFSDSEFRRALDGVETVIGKSFDGAEADVGGMRWRLFHARPIWTGYLHNALILVCVFLFCISMAWVPRAPEWLAATRRQRALARGRCPSCGYQLGGLPDMVCPECGKSWDLTAEDPVVGAFERGNR